MTSLVGIHITTLNFLLFFLEIFISVNGYVTTPDSAVSTSNRKCRDRLKRCESWTCEQLSVLGSVSQRTFADTHVFLPKASIIIVFFNEDLYRLQKTLDSIFANTSSNLIQEVILVDDCSDTVDTQKLVLPSLQVHVLRNTDREGLIKSRMIGARVASGDVIVFLDSHVEVDTFWLEPLLARLVNFRIVRELNLDCSPGSKFYSLGKCDPEVRPERLIVSPIIYDLTWPEDPIRYEVLGGFTWNLTFRWDLAEERTQTLLKSLRPVETPAVSGGIFATWRQSFFEMGGYDEKMDIWGGENIELSLRTWMCYGRMEIVPCSRVGHLFRSVHPYSFPQGKSETVVRNLKRVALIWLLQQGGEKSDQKPVSQHLARYYAMSPFAMSISAGDVTDRRELAKMLNCRSFRWYVNEVYPLLMTEAEEIMVPEFVSYLAELEAKYR
ncbi:unnamed protein product [Calicophoron daubneyi]|uniref:Glycosyltransferase 2-like domain-containing protein n=1 Tax=Calicophoron daubneyi TaxID=300641 RepID=A0AAV2TRF9_CALDB